MPCAGQGHRLGADLGRDVGKFLARAAGRKFDLARVLNQREIVIVDGDRDVALRALRGGRIRLAGRAGAASRSRAAAKRA